MTFWASEPAAGDADARPDALAPRGAEPGPARRGARRSRRRAIGSRGELAVALAALVERDPALTAAGLAADARLAAAYLVRELSAPHLPRFAASGAAVALVEALHAELDAARPASRSRTIASSSPRPARRALGPRVDRRRRGAPARAGRRRPSRRRRRRPRPASSRDTVERR